MAHPSNASHLATKVVFSVSVPLRSATATATARTMRTSTTTATQTRMRRVLRLFSAERLASRSIETNTSCCDARTSASIYGAAPTPRARAHVRRLAATTIQSQKSLFVLFWWNSTCGPGTRGASNKDEDKITFTWGELSELWLFDLMSLRY